jgi:hypothetical protein
MQAALDSSRSGSMLKEEYVIGLRPLEIGWDHSLLGVVKQLAYLISHLKHGSSGAPSAKIQVPGVRTAVLAYSVLAPVCWCLLYWFRLRFLPVLNQLIVFLISCVLLPFVSNEYTLVHIYLAWGALILFLFEDVRTGWIRLSPRALSVMLACFAVLFSPQSYWIAGDVDNFGGQVKMTALVVLLWTVVKTPMPSSSLGDLV